MLRGRVAKALGQQHPIRPPSRKHNLDKAAIGFSSMRLMLQSVVKASGVRRWGGEAADGQNCPPPHLQPPTPRTHCPADVESRRCLVGIKDPKMGAGLISVQSFTVDFDEEAP